MNFHVVIPARFASQRLPGKPLLDIHGKPMIVRVVEAVSACGAGDVIVATDDERIREVVSQAGYQAVMTRADHPSGSDRVMEVVRRKGWADQEVVLNVQGDEPLIPGAVIEQLATCLTGRRTLASATLCEPITRGEDLFDPNVVKVVRTSDKRALYFSRAPIPFARGVFDGLPGELPARGNWFRHIGVYAFRVWALEKFVSLPTGDLEAIESLEQLRLLENGLEMQVEETRLPVPGGVDTLKDLERVRAVLSPGR